MIAPPAPARPPAAWMRALELLLFALALLAAGLVTLALAWAGDAPYRDLARDNGVGSVVMLSHGPGGDVAVPTGLDALVAMHQEWSSYVTGGRDDPPERTFGRSTWTDDEYSHMADVRRVFDVAKFFVPLSLVVIIVRLQRARARSSREMWRLVRDGAVAAGLFIAIVGLLAAVAFEQLFLLFHYVFFPQGNFLFDPATSNLVRLYPDWYWEGISLRVGLSFLALVVLIVAVATLRLRTAK